MPRHPNLPEITESTPSGLTFTYKVFAGQKLVSDNERKTMVKMYFEGKNSYEIAPLLGRTAACVIQNIKRSTLNEIDKAIDIINKIDNAT